MLEQNIVYYGETTLLQRKVVGTRPLNVVFLTSVRDTGTCDRNGTVVETGSGPRYDVIVSDHYMARLDYLWGEFGLYGRVLNIHPAVTIAGHPNCFRGKTLTASFGYR